MILSNKNLIGLPVFSKSGLLLGKIKSFEIEAETQTIVRYSVKTRNLIGNFLSEKDSELVVGRNQVISINEEKMTVDDILEKIAERARSAEPIRKDVPALGSKISINDNRAQ